MISMNYLKIIHVYFVKQAIFLMEMFVKKFVVLQVKTYKHILVLQYWIKLEQVTTIRHIKSKMQMLVFNCNKMKLLMIAFYIILIYIFKLHQKLQLIIYVLSVHHNPFQLSNVKQQPIYLLLILKNNQMGLYYHILVLIV